MSRSCWRRTWKEFGERRYVLRQKMADRWCVAMYGWPSPGLGRYYKRQLSKARRHYYKMIDIGIRARYPAGIEAECNYKTW